MAEPKKIINNPSITTDVFEYDEVGRVSAISGHPLAGEGGGTIEKSDLMWKPTVGSDGYVSWSLASSATQPEAAYISGAQGPAGPQGVSGNPGKTPEFQINSTNAHWEWKYSGDAEWKDLNVVASGAVGPKGDPCLSAWKPTVNEGILSWKMTESTDNPGIYTIPSGISLSAASAENFQARKTTVQIWEKGASTFDTSFDLPWGQDGVSGTSISARVVEDHANKKSTVTLFDPYSSPEHIIQSFEVKDGNDGEGFVEAHHYQSLSAGYADYARFSDNSVSSMDQIKGSIDWGNEIAQEYKTHSGYFVTSAANLFDTTHKYGLVKDNQGNVSWGSISEGVANVSHDNTLVGNGNTEQLCVAWSALSGRTIENANNATNATYATNLGDSNSHSGLSDITNAFATKQPVGTYATSGTIPNDNKQYALTHNGWAEVQGGGSSYTFDNTAANKTLSGTGASNDPIGVNTAQFYRKTETSGTSELTNAFDQKVEYYTRTDSEAALKAQKLFVCTSDSDIIDKVSHADGKGCIFFRLG